VVLDDVLKPDGQAKACASFVVEAGVPGINPA
jgi:hypothetical protein